ncbi:MAG: hypothetical protein WGN25_10205 [Candidatus Electrothrix sp. GW3-4]|uniref:hypothetical protein n=1 Tax=Candidatus Electrothrix sp. GW3-4 TaxID=3126740 RepID=UPI0030CA84D9
MVLYEDFDFDVLNDPEFKEDSVREELVQPLVKFLGYKVSGNIRVIRSRSLKHPFVSIGSTRNKISIIPDYVFEVNGKVHWILDAKSPSENISKTKHVEQAYSYSIHPEIRSNLYALCNGREFILYDVKKNDPVLFFKMTDIDESIENLVRILDPRFMANSDVVDFYPDLGLALRKIGKSPGFRFIALSVHANFISKVQDGKYTTSTLIPDDGRGLLGSFDFDENLYRKLLSIVDEEKARLIEQSLSQQPYSLMLENEEFLFGLVADLQGEVVNKPEESFVPFKVIDFMPYSEAP